MLDGDDNKGPKRPRLDGDTGPDPKKARGVANDVVEDGGGEVRRLRPRSASSNIPGNPSQFARSRNSAGRRSAGAVSARSASAVTTTSIVTPPGPELASQMAQQVPNFPRSPTSYSTLSSSIASSHPSLQYVEATSGASTLSMLIGVLPLVTLLAIALSFFNFQPWKTRYCDSHFDDNLEPGHPGLCMPCDPEGLCAAGSFDCDLTKSVKQHHRCVPCNATREANGTKPESCKERDGSYYCTTPDMDMFDLSEGIINHMHQILGENMCETLRTSPRLTRRHMSLPIKHIKYHLKNEFKPALDDQRFDEV